MIRPQTRSSCSFLIGGLFRGWPDDWLAKWNQWSPSLTPPLPAQTSGKLTSNFTSAECIPDLLHLYFYILFNCASLCNQWINRLLNFSLCCISLIAEQSAIAWQLRGNFIDQVMFIWSSIVQFQWINGHCSFRLLFLADRCRTQAVFCCCSPHASRFDMFCILSCFSAHRGCK